MTLSKLIDHLQSLLEEQGDMPVMVSSAMQGYQLSEVRHLVHWDRPISGGPYAEIG